MKNVELSVIIPVYNETSIIRKNVSFVHKTLTREDIEFEIIVVNDGSSDRTKEEILEAKRELKNVKLVSYRKNRGKGYAIRAGVKAARGAFTLYTDADLAYDPSQIKSFLAAIKSKKVDAVLGSRSLPDSNVDMQNADQLAVFSRRFYSRIFNMLVECLFGLGIGDTQCGIKCFRTHTLKKISDRQRSDRFCYDVELLVALRQNGYHFQEIPVKLRAYTENSKVKPMKDSIDMFMDLLMIKRRQLLSRYSLAL